MSWTRRFARGTRRRGGCCAATIPRTTSPRAACRPSCVPPHTRSTATSARPIRSSTARAARPRPTSAAPRWTRGRRSSRRATRRASRSSARSPTPPPATALPLGELRTYMRSMRIDCAPGADRQLGRARRLHGRLGRLGRADHGRAARRARAPPRRPRPPRPRVPARELHPRRARGPAPGPRLPARRGPRALRRQRGRPRGRRRDPEVRALLAHEVERARALFAGARPAIASAPASVRPGVRFATGLYGAHARPRRGDGLRRARRARPACASGTSRAPRSRRSAMTRRATLRGADAHAARRSAPTC